MNIPIHRPALGWTLATAALLGAASLAGAQELPCGSELEPWQVPHAIALQEAGAYDWPDQALPQPFSFAGAPSYVVPLTFHVVRRSNGSEGLSMARLQTALADANSHYAPIGIQFCIAGPIDYIDDDALYFDIDTRAEVDALRVMNWVPNTINIYFTEVLDTESGGLCGISAFTFSAVQSIAMRNSCTATSTNHSTFSHEIGHYFDLYHTHTTSTGDECVDGSNCAVAGDLVCDTPADPRLSSSTVTSSCVYVGGESDNCNNDPYAPQVENLMSYSRKQCRDLFTTGQYTRALATLVNLRPELALPICAGGVVEYCSPGTPNSTGQPSTMSLQGSGLVADNNLTLRTTGLPLGQFGYYLNGRMQATPVTPPGSQGSFCLGGNLGRYNAPGEIGFTGMTGEIALTLDLTQTPTSQSAVSILSGETWHFQLWHRDWVNNSSTSNFSNAIAVTFR